MSTENSVTPPVESASTVPDSPVSSHDADSPQPETPVVEAVEEQQPADATSPSEPASTASASGEAQQDSGSAASPEEPRRRVQLNPTLDPNIARPVPSIAPQAPAPMETGVVAEAAASAASSSEQPHEVTEQPADVQAVEESSPVEDVTGDKSTSESAAPLRPVEPVALPPKNEQLDADIEAQLEAAMSSSEEETPVIPDVEQGAASLAVTDENIKQGTRLTGTVQSIHGDDMLIDFGLRYSGVLSRRQFGLRKQPMQGEPIEVIVNRIDESEGLMHVNLPTAGAKVRGGWEEISVDQVVECVVNQTNKGGLEVSVGSLRGFMPASQVELGYVSDLNVYVGQKFQAHVTEVNPKRRKLVLSRRKLLEESREQTEKDVFGKIAPGQTYEGRVKTLKDYGAFIDIGGVDGLLHVGQISWSRINHPSEVLSEGQMIEVKVLSVDQEKKKIGLGMRQMTQNPWRTAEEKYAPNSVVSGKVTRIEGFGAFVELEPGIEGLVHISELDHKRVKTVHEVLRVGQAVDVQVIEVNPSKKRISLSLKALKEKPEDDSSIAEDVPVVQHISPESLKGGIGEPTGGKLFGDPSKFGR
ncbi:MAG: S1 RNA-binding domain-containing protein [Planctomycetaceae bacterium]|nr:S1 RNA-binding domain-containing protein [Planctomycetaceae bacterium]